jgi:endonuclease VIII-like 3
MVEGPKVVLKCERLGKLVHRVLLSTSDLSLKILEGKTCERVFSVGKELFIVFGTVSIRLHFQMSGSERVVPSGAPPPDLNIKSRKVLTVKLMFDSMGLYLYDTSVSLRNDEYVRNVEQRIKRDICNPNLSYSEVVQLLSVDKRTLMDAIMDQTILPGVGNIIKCEGLFQSRLHPGMYDLSSHNNDRGYNHTRLNNHLMCVFRYSH